MNTSTLQEAEPNGDETGMLQLIDGDQKLFYVPINECKSFFVRLPHLPGRRSKLGFS